MVTWMQLRRRGVAKATISRALRAGRLHEVHPGVYSIVPPSLRRFEAWHAAAILAGGAGSCLCAQSAGWWARVLQRRPPVIHVAIRNDHRPVDGIRWHRLKLADGERGHLRGMPITAPQRIPLDLAASLSLSALKGVLAELEFQHGIEPVQVALRRGYPGTAKLRRAIAEHTPQLAHTRAGLQREFLRFLIRCGFELPEFNHPVGKSTVDAVYEQQKIVIELDGVAGHTGERRVLRDHRRDMHRRADGYLPLRYHYAQIIATADQVLIEAELDRFGVPRRRRRPAGRRPG